MTRPQKNDFLPCEVCGKPGYAAASPAGPVTTQILCEEHAAQVSSFNPILLLFNLAVLGVVAGAVYLLIRWIW